MRAVWYGGFPVKLPARGERLCMVVVKDFGQEPSMLLTNCRINLRVKADIKQRSVVKRPV